VTVRIRNITIDCADPYQLVCFWAQVTGYAEDPGNPNAPEDPEGALIAPDGSAGLLFITVPEAKQVKNRVHLDLVPVGRIRDEEVDRLLGIGAALVDDRRRPDGSGWVVLADPEGNEFCVERSDAEQATTAEGEAAAVVPTDGELAAVVEGHSVVEIASGTAAPAQPARAEPAPAEPTAPPL
jgi:hypothetical protein